ncbi:hypothetical protein [Maricaulis sp. CAU 1757]
MPSFFTASRLNLRKRRRKPLRAVFILAVSAAIGLGAAALVLWNQGVI